jgi:tRNA (mo5U34)-methyltransferase
VSDLLRSCQRSSHILDPLVDLGDEIRRLGPWHHEIEVAPGVSTRLALEETYPDHFGLVSFLNLRDEFRRKILAVYPGGLAGRSVLDCGCNCGECLFWAKELGAGDCYGFDARDHWIAQGRFLIEHSQLPSDGVTLEVRDLYEIPSLGLEPFDIVLFHGLLYHLPDPVTGLRIAADLTSELIVVNTATASGFPDGMLLLEEESRSTLLSGIHGLNGRPTGPDVVARMLRWMGFAETTTLWYEPDLGNGWGRLEVLGSKREGSLGAHNSSRNIRGQS